MLGLRGGVQKDLHTSESMTFSSGVSIRYRLFQLDYAYVRPPTLPSSHRFSLSFFFNLYASMIRITEVKIDNLFPAFHKRYGIHPLGNVEVVNRDDEPHETTVSVYIPRLMEAPTEQQVIVRPKETKEVDITGVFSSAITDLTEDIRTQAEVKVAYTTERRTRSHKKSERLFVYNRNATTWDDLRREAAFITSTDPIVRGFARPTLVTHEQEIKALGRASRNVLRAMVLFAAVSGHGVRYIADPNNPYSRMSADKSAVDNIQYPVEVLREKSGDCDDLTALYCALLESVGISTALVDAPGHIFLMFDSGVPIEEVSRLPVDASLYVVRNGGVWIPVEITVLGRSFMEAWRSGAGECARLVEEDQLRVVDTSAAWEVYEPSPPQFEGEIPPPRKEDLQESLTSDRLSLKELMEAFIDRTYVGPLGKRPGDLELRFDLARVYLAIGEYDRAIAEYQRLLEAHADPARVYNNMGIAYFLKGEVWEAAQQFKRAMELDPQDEGIRGNLELSLSALGKEERDALAREMGVSVSGEEKAAEFEVDEESFYWRE
jgi:tetratricopeptide (TPR) repeat protein